MRKVITWMRLPENRLPIYLAVCVIGAVLTTVLGSIWWLTGALALVLLHLVFRDTLNVFQWFPWWGKMRYRLYWYTRNNADTNSRVLWMGYIYSDIFGAGREVVAYFSGKGPQIRFKRWSFQVGIGKLTQGSPYSRMLDVSVEDIKKGHAGVWEQDNAITSS
jgi:hypothetical protein